MFILEKAVRKDHRPGLRMAPVSPCEVFALYTTLS